MLRRLAILVLLAAGLATPARAQPVELMPSVTYDRTVEFTPHGAVVLNVITAPRPGTQNGLYDLAPVAAHGTIGNGLEPLTQLEQDVSAQATVAGVNGDFERKDTTPAGMLVQGGVLEHPPLGTRSSIGIDTSGTLHVGKVRFVGTWRGTGQRRPLNGIDRLPLPGDVVLFTQAWGATVPVIAKSAEVTFATFPAAVPNTDLSAVVTDTHAGGGEPIPSGGAVLMAVGGVAAKLQAEAPVGTTIASRLILQPAWPNLVSALGGGPLLVKAGKPVFHSVEDFANDLIASRSPRSAVGQLADGRVILVAVDGGRPGYSVGLTSYELAQAMARLGAVTASGLGVGTDVTAAFDGALLNRPSSTPAAVKEGLLVRYFGVYAAPVPVALLNGDAGRTQEPLSYKLVRPSTVTAQLVAPDGSARPLESGVQHAAGSYSFTASTFDQEGLWHWNVTATDDLGRQSAIDRTFRYDTTLRGVRSPSAGTVAFTLTRPATVRVQIETAGGLVLDTLPDTARDAGDWTAEWDGTLAAGGRAHAGSYVAHVFATSAVGTSDLATPIRLAP